MRKSQRTYTVLAALLIILALLLPIIGITVASHVFRPDSSVEAAVGEDLLLAFFTALSFSVVTLLVLLVTCSVSCVLAGVAIRCASSAVAMARAEGRSILLPRILHIAAIIEAVLAALAALAPLVLLLAVLSI